MTPSPLRSAVRGNKIVEAPHEEIDFELDSPNKFFGSHVGLIPMQSAVQSPRLFYGARFFNQAMPVRNPEAPWVQNKPDDDERSFDEILGQHAGAFRADTDGEVTKVTSKAIHLKTGAGEKKISIYDRQPFNRKTAMTSTPVVKPGDRVTPGQLLARSNFTDQNGTLAMGRNARVGLLAYKGHSMDDAVVISEDFAKNLVSEHLYNYEQEYDNDLKGGRNHFVSLFPTKYKAKQLEALDEDGVVKVGTTIKAGDPLVLATKPRAISSASTQLGKLSKALRDARADASQSWHYDEDGVVTDVVKTSKGAQVYVQTYQPTKVGDKITQRSGNKGVISKIIPTDQMPRTADGKPLDILLNHLGLPSRVNSSLLYEVLLGKVASKTGQPYKLPSFNKKGETWYDFVKAELDKAGLSDTEEIYDPAENRKLERPVTVGNMYVQKLHHTSESKLSSRGVGSYSADQQPSRGGGENAQSKRLSGLETTSLLSAGAYSTLREASTLRGARCFDPETEVLTQRGWVKWPLVTSTDRLFTRSKEDERIGWFEVPQQLVVTQHTGELLGYEGRHVDWLVTPDHAFWGVPSTVSRSKPWRKKRIFTAEEAYGKEGSFDAYGTAYNGSFSSSQIIKFTAKNCSPVKRRVKEASMTLIDYCRLIGWWGSEGSASVDKEGRGAITIAQMAEVNADHFSEIEQLMQRIGLGPGVATKVSASAGKNSVVKLDPERVGKVSGKRWRSRPLAEHLMQFGKRSWTKRLPALVFEAPLEARLELLRCYGAGDPCVRSTQGSEHTYVSSSSPRMIEDLQRLALLSGLSAHIGVCKGSSYKRPHYRLIFGDNLTEVTYRKRPADQFKGHYRVQYSGLVYCATMRTGLLYVRRNGKSMWSGNCDDYWRTLRSGYKPHAPGTPFVFEKFKSLLAGAGIRTRSHAGGKLRLGPFTDQDLDDRKPVEVQNGELVDLNTLDQTKGGLFDPVMTAGNKWGRIKLPHRMPNPAFQDQLCKLLGLKERELRAILSGDMELPEHLR
jgi:hypothetical protein